MKYNNAGLKKVANNEWHHRARSDKPMSALEQFSAAVNIVSRLAFGYSAKSHGII